MVESLDALDQYPYSGHSAIMGFWKREWQDADTVLGYFGHREKAARRKYREYVEQGAGQGRRPDLVGGGLIRSLGGWEGVQELGRWRGRFKGDERILGESEFVGEVLKASEEAMERRVRIEGGYVCISTSKGCPFHCTYCASPFLTKGFVRRDPFKVVEEIEYWTSKYHINNIAFYDDALLIEPSHHFIPMMREIIRRGIQCNFHAPNGLHIREIDEEVAGLLFRGGFKTLRLGFETSDEVNQIETGGKVDNHEFLRTTKYLKRAGYSSEEIGVYIMAGLPGQRVGEVEESIAFVKDSGAKPILVEYSPISHTTLFEKAKKMSQFDLENEPLFHNNSIIPCQWEGFTLENYKRLKEDLRRG
jgi:pyruvate-formate lyase-activating enzyme